MTWFIWQGDHRTAVAPHVEITVGRDPTCDVVVNDRRVSRRHLFVQADETGWHLRDHSSNGTFAHGELLRELHGTEPIALHLGGRTGPRVLLNQDATKPTWTEPDAAGPGPDASAPAGVLPTDSGLLRLDATMRIGRAADNTLVLDDLLVSNHHAHVVPVDGAFDIVDLSSSRGTFVNGQRIKTHRLRDGDVISIGRSRFRFQTGQLIPTAITSGVGLRADHLRVLAGETTLLHDVSLELQPRQMLAVIGASGSGKSTLLGALTGQRPAAAGTVMVDGADLYQNYGEWRQRIGYVPQTDLLHTQLPVQTALEYGARLRFPPDTTAAQRRSRVRQVMDDLGLANRAEVRIDRLSGGQRKRTSVALELLTSPSLLFLDEPTSGLDPGLDLQIMMMLRELADAGQTVVVVTHAVTNLSLCDQVLILASGGYVAYYGPPAEAVNYFGARDYAEIFLMLDRVPGEEWQRRWTKRTSSMRNALPARRSAPQQQHRAPATQSMLSQIRTLTSRYLKVISSDRAYTAFLVIMPVILAALGFVVGDKWGLGAADPTTENPFGLNPQARSILLVLVLGAAFAGCATSIQELVKERTIYLRERSVGVSRTAYVISKMLVLGGIAALQGLAFAFLSLLGRPAPQSPVVLGAGVVEIAVAVALLAVASAAIGLALSAYLPSRETALPVLVIVTMLQVVLSGAVPVRFSSALDAVGWTAPAFWAFNAMASTTGLNQLLGQDPPNALWTADAAHWWRDVAVVTVSVPVLITLAVLILGRWDPSSQRVRR